MGVLEGITHSEEINTILNDAQQKYNNTIEKMENQKDNTTNSLEKLGQQKIDAWSKDMNRFLGAFSAFNNVQMVCKLDEKFDFVGKNTSPDELMINVQQATANANEVLRNGALAIGTGALVGVATYGGVAMFAKASTGTAIATLSGVAKKNATLAWLGGGSIKSGGFGMLGGKVILGGVVVTAIIGVSTVLAATKAKEKLAEAKKVHAEVENAVSKMNLVITGMKGIQKISDNYTEFIKNLSKLFSPYLDEMERIATKYPKDEDGKVNYDLLSEMEQKTLHLSWLLAQLYYHVLSISLLTDDGNVNPTSKQLLNVAQNEYSKLSGESNRLENEKKQINDLLTTAQNQFSISLTSFIEHKHKTCVSLQKIGKERFNLWISRFSPIIDAISNFEDIDLENAFQYKITDLPIETIIEQIDNILYIHKQLSSGRIHSINSNEFTEIALHGGANLFSQISQSNDASNTSLHEMTLWFSETQNHFDTDQIVFSGVSNFHITSTKQIVESISGRENLDHAKEINNSVMQLKEAMESAENEFDFMIKKFNTLNKYSKKLCNIQKSFIKEITSICKQYPKTNGTIPYKLLTKTEKRVIEMSMRIIEMQYFILDSSILSTQNGGVQEALESLEIVDKTLHKIKKDAFCMKGENIQVSNLLWQRDAQISMYGGFACGIIYLILLILQIINANLWGLVGIPGAIIACPLFFYFKNLPQSKLFMWRCIRIVVSVILVLGIEIIGMVL